MSQMKHLFSKELSRISEQGSPLIGRDTVELKIDEYINLHIPTSISSKDLQALAHKISLISNKSQSQVHAELQKQLSKPM